MNHRTGGVDVSSLIQVFEPGSVAVIGASADRNRIGGRIVAGNLDSGFSGILYPVNPKRDEILGLRAYPSIQDTPTVPEMAIIAVPALAVPEAIRDCAQAGVGAAVVLTSGFAETGEAGANAQAEIVAIARKAGMRLLGPNCMGFFNQQSRLVASFGRLPNPPAVFDGICVASQSGAVGVHLATAMHARRMAYRLWVSTGNQVDIDLADCIAYMAGREGTRVILGCLEGVPDGPKFRAALRFAQAQEIPIVLMKIGRSEVGSHAAATHTAALAGSEVVFDEVLRSHNVHNARSIDEALDVAYACSLGRFPRKPSIGLATTSGGFGIMMADSAAQAGLAVPALPAEAQARLKAIVPFAGTRNPVDMTGQYLNDPTILEPMIGALLEGGGHEAVISYIGTSRVIPSLAPNLEALTLRYPERLNLFVLGGFPDVTERLERAGALVFDDPIRAVLAVGALVRLGAAQLEASADEPGPMSGLSEQLPDGLLDEAHSKAILAGAGVTTVRHGVAKSTSEAVRLSQETGYPVVMKVLSPDIPHKSEVGGVLLDIRDAGQAAQAYGSVLANVAAAAPAARIEGVLVSPMIGEGVEMILGIKRDEIFGPCVILGLGGIFVEILRDNVTRLAPVSLAGAHGMIDALKGVALLKGARGRAAADVDALAETIVALSRFAMANADWLEGVDINPLIVRTQGLGAVAVDGLVSVSNRAVGA